MSEMTLNNLSQEGSAPENSSIMFGNTTAQLAEINIKQKDDNLNGKFYASTSRNRNTKDGIYWGTRGNLKSCTMLLKSIFI
ncbi:GL24848 [Drosophila persimilis]|uniref:GL24848 n=1 Tax=Drosophila persimilis TaxID=7234 RepID=B4GRX9_DROPE|nr:GL24848 [Drosophila persimilis]